jgi:hypothetical protein
MTSLHALSLVAVLGAGIPSAAFAVTGLDTNGVSNGTQGSLTDPNRPSQPGTVGADRFARHTPPDETGTAPTPGSQNRDPNRPLGFGKAPGDNSPAGLLSQSVRNTAPGCPRRVALDHIPRALCAL